MYTSHAEFVIPEGTEEMSQEFFATFCLHQEIQTEDENAYFSSLHEYETNPNLPFCILEMIKESLVDKNEVYDRYLDMLTAYFIRLFEMKKIIHKSCKENAEYKISLFSSILYLLPYAAQIFQENQQILCFKHLYSALIQEINNYDVQTINLFNQYIYELLSSETLTPHKIIISMILATNFSILEPNKELFLQHILFLIQNLPKCNLDNEMEKLSYQILFTDLSFYLKEGLADDTIKLDLFTEAVDQYILYFIQKCRSDEGNSAFNADIELIEQIPLLVLDILDDYEYELKKPQNAFEPIVKNLSNIFYKRGVDLISSSDNLLASTVCRIISKTARYITIDDPDYLTQFIFVSSSLSQKDKDEIDESEDVFFYDFYDISCFKKNDFSNRQSICLFIQQFPQALNVIASFLEFSKTDHIVEEHFFLISVSNIIIAYQNVDRSTKATFYQLTIDYMRIALEFLNELTSQNFFHNIEITLFILTIYQFIKSSFFLLNDEEITTFNNEISRLMSIIEAFSEEFPSNNHVRTFFTFYCIFSTKLFERSALTVPPDQIVLFTEKYFDNCITNHAIKLMSIFAFDDKNIDLLMKIFERYFSECESIISELLSKSISVDEDEEEEQDERLKDMLFEIPNDKQSEYNIQYFRDNISRMSKIIRNIDFSCFDNIQNKLQSMLRFLVVKGEDWPFIDESISLTSAILIKAPNFKQWTQYYTDLAFEFNRHVFFSEWVNPLIEIVSMRPEIVDQEYADYLLINMKKCIEAAVNTENGDNRKAMPTIDVLNRIALIMRIFELGISSEINFQPEIVSFFLDITIQSLPSEQDALEIEEDFLIEDHKFGFNMLKLASFLAFPEINIEEIIQFLNEIVNEGQVVCNEIRYIIIILIDNVIKPDENSELNELRNLCLTNEVPKNDSFRQIYISNINNLFGNMNHPIYNLYPIENFVFDDNNTPEEEEVEE